MRMRDSATLVSAMPGEIDHMKLTKKIGVFWATPWLEKVQRVGEFYWLLKTQYYYRFFWGHIGKGSKLIQPMRLRNVHNIQIGDDVIVSRYAFLLTLQVDDSVIPRILIGNGCRIGHLNHIASVHEVQIGANVLTADRVFISDHSHGFSDISVPILQQPVVSKGPVSIGDGTWIGENASVISCRIGRNCVIGSNAVVLSDIPDYCVAVGAPARIVRRRNP
jgi:acetyltransferase-like isoleucine patch superfamily enzyme